MPDQLYYWTSLWQQDEAASLAELERGEALVFGSGADAIRWLAEDEFRSCPSPASA